MYKMFSLLDKIFIHLYSILKILFYKIKFGSKLKVGKKVVFRRKLIIRIEKDGVLEIKDDNFFNSGCTINVLKHVVIGNNNRFGEDVKIYDHNHKIGDYEWKEYTTSELNIGNNNWICSNCVLLKGSQIGNNCVVGAGNVVDYVIEDNTLVKKGEKTKIYKKDK